MIMRIYMDIGMRIHMLIPAKDTCMKGICIMDMGNIPMLMAAHTPMSIEGCRR